MPVAGVVGYKRLRAALTALRVMIVRLVVGSERFLVDRGMPSPSLSIGVGDDSLMVLVIRLENSFTAEMMSWPASIILSTTCSNGWCTVSHSTSLIELLDSASASVVGGKCDS